MKALSGKPKRCKVCRSEFVPRQGFQTWCSPDCGYKLSQAKQSKERAKVEKTERAEIRQAKERIKTRSDHLKDAQKAVNEFIRLRDAELPCISCGRHHQGKYDAGHYRTVAAAPELRFNPLNIHKQCSPCNTQKSGNIVEYRINLVKKIGAEAVEWLEGPHEPAKLTIEDIKAITAKYRALVRELKRKLAQDDHAS